MNFLTVPGALDSDRDLIADDTHLPEPQNLIARALARQDPDRLSAHQLAADDRQARHTAHRARGHARQLDLLPRRAADPRRH